MSDLSKKSCKPCEGDILPMKQTEVNKSLKDIPKWETDSMVSEIFRVFEFKNYYQTIAFVNAVAWIAHTENHHPDLTVSYNRCRVRYSTHAIKGLSENDFICAAKVDALV